MADIGDRDALRTAILDCDADEPAERKTFWDYRPATGRDAEQAERAATKRKPGGNEMSGYGYALELCVRQITGIRNLRRGPAVAEYPNDDANHGARRAFLQGLNPFWITELARKIQAEATVSETDRGN